MSLYPAYPKRGPWRGNYIDNPDAYERAKEARIKANARIGRSKQWMAKTPDHAEFEKRLMVDTQEAEHGLVHAAVVVVLAHVAVRGGLTLINGAADLNQVEELLVNASRVALSQIQAHAISLRI